MSRYVSDIIADFTKKKFVLLAGPRQVGKTTVAKEWLSTLKGSYLNWDVAEDREAILKKKFLSSSTTSALLLDEIHKYPRWRNYIKGLFDKESTNLRVVVTGSARLDVYRKGGDSLFGRYELLRLHPLTIGELTHCKMLPPPEDWLSPGNLSGDKKIWERLLLYSGFPEPYTEQDILQYGRWSTRRRELLIREDLRDISEIKLVDLVEHLYLLLPERVGSPLSLNALKEELQVAFNTVSSWISVLERLYICYRLSPYHAKLSRSLKKEQKLYLWDWSQVKDPGNRFENMVAGHLLKATHAWTDLGYGDFALQYWRNKEKEEVDFVITKNRLPVALIECKVTDTKISKSLINLSSMIGNIPAVQLVDIPNIDIQARNTRVVTAKDYLANLI
jgi:predicted AAA+ superfamily ATPase